MALTRAPEIPARSSKRIPVIPTRQSSQGIIPEPLHPRRGKGSSEDSVGAQSKVTKPEINRLRRSIRSTARLNEEPTSHSDLQRTDKPKRITRRKTIHAPPPKHSDDSTFARRKEMVEKNVEAVFEDYMDNKREIQTRELEELSSDPSKYFSEAESNKRERIRRNLDKKTAQKLADMTQIVKGLDSLHPDHQPIP